LNSKGRGLEKKVFGYKRQKMGKHFVLSRTIKDQIGKLGSAWGKEGAWERCCGERSKEKGVRARRAITQLLLVAALQKKRAPSRKNNRRGPARATKQHKGSKNRGDGEEKEELGRGLLGEKG